MSKAILFLLLMVAINNTYAQERNLQSPAFIEWDEVYSLRWEDFQGSRKNGVFGDAATAVNIKATPRRVNKKLVYTVSVMFLKNDSWADKRSDKLLKHERLHFDIAELYARKVRQKINELSEQDESDYKVYNQAINVILKESNEVDRQYDIETLHGGLAEKQSAWVTKVKSELAVLDAYKGQKESITATTVEGL